MNHREKEKLFKTLFDAYYERLYYAAATILGDQMVAEDIIEDVFEHYWERINDDAITNSPSYAYFLTQLLRFILVFLDNQRFVFLICFTVFYKF